MRKCCAKWQIQIQACSGPNPVVRTPRYFTADTLTALVSWCWVTMFQPQHQNHHPCQYKHWRWRRRRGKTKFQLWMPWKKVSSLLALARRGRCWKKTKEKGSQACQGLTEYLNSLTKFNWLKNEGASIAQSIDYTCIPAKIIGIKTSQKQAVKAQLINTFTTVKEINISTEQAAQKCASKRQIN